MDEASCPRDILTRKTASEANLRGMANRPTRKYAVKKRIIKRKKNGGGNGTRTRADKVLAQGVGKTVARAFGSTRATGLAGWDAFSPAHLPLPRSVGPYTVVRTTSLLESNDHFNLIGCFRHHEVDYSSPNYSNSEYWSNVGLLTSVDSTVAINSTANGGNGKIQVIPFPGAGNVAGSAFTAVPAAISVQVMNPNPLQTTEGIVAGCVSSTQLDLRDRPENWQVLGQEIISFMKPRLMSAGKLSLRGIQADSYPLNMNALSDFLEVRNLSSGKVTMNSHTFDGAPVGFAPIVIVNEGSTSTPPLKLNFLVTIEWRVRFDISNPAVSSHLHHGVTSDGHWDSMIRAASARGHGMCDIVERVATAGASLAKTAGAAYQAYQTVSPMVQAALF